MKRSQLRRGAPLKRSSVPLRSSRLERGTQLKTVSPKRQTQNAKYAAGRRAFLAEHRFCQFPLGCVRRAVVVHHRRGRFGLRLLDVTWWAASCVEHNDFAETRTGEALACGWLVRIEGAA